MLLSDTITAPATAAGRSPRAIVRISGPLTHPILARILGWGESMSQDGAIPTGACRGRLRLPTAAGETELPCLALIWKAPRSYTGQDAAELFLPGSPTLIERIVRLILAHPPSPEHGAVRLAGPGEFTARAYLAGKMNLDQAEAVQALIAARSDDQLDAAARLMRGHSGASLLGAAERLASALALIEAGIDFTDQDDVVAITTSDLRSRLQRIIGELDAVLGPRAVEERSAEPVVALVGPPNAGKSTLFNALLERPRAIVSEVAGATRDAIRETLTLPGEGWTVDAVALVDLAGLDQALADRSRADAAAQAAAGRAVADADVLIFCDPQGQFETAEPFRSIAAAARPIIRVRTKADLPGDIESASSSSDAQAIAVCALDGWNLGALRRAIADAAGARVASGAGAAAILPRRRRALVQARDSLSGALKAMGPPEVSASGPESPEVVAASMREALDHLGEVTGAIHPDDIIGRVFATFCIGK